MEHKKRVVIIHDYDASPLQGWYPWLKKQLEAKEFNVLVLEMPETSQPELAGWLSHLHQMIIDPNKNVFLVGHGLGGTAALRYLESLPAGTKIGGLVVVAALVESIGLDALESFFAKPINWSKIKSKDHKFIAIYSDDDPIVPLKQGQLLEKKLKANLVIREKMKHFSTGELIELPSVLNSVIEMAKE